MKALSIVTAMMVGVICLPFMVTAAINPVIFRPATGLWAVRGVTRFYFGRKGDQPMPGSYIPPTPIPAPTPAPTPGGYYSKGANTVKGVSQPNIRAAIFRPSTGLWAVRGVTRIYFGGPGDIAIDPDLAPTAGGTGTSVEINEINWGGTIGQGTPGGQWIELYNYGDSSVSLSGWSLGNGTWTISLDGTIDPKDYFVMADDGTDPTGDKRDFKYDTSTYPMSSSQSSGNQLTLNDSSLTARDIVSCNSSWVAGAENKSMERIDPEFGNCDLSHWNTAVNLYGGFNYGTPGAKNSQQLY